MLLDILLYEIENHEIIDQLDVQVDQGFTVSSGKLSSFKIYCVRTFLKADPNIKIEVLRRYSDFDWLSQKLIISNPGISIPTLPAKDFWGKYVYESEKFNDSRRLG